MEWGPAFLAWFLFNYFRKYYIEEYPFEINNKLIVDSLAIASLWVLLYFIFGNYKNVYKKYRIKEITQTVSQSFIGIFFIFFILLLDDNIQGYKDYYNSVLSLIHI